MKLRRCMSSGFAVPRRVRTSTPSSGAAARTPRQPPATKPPFAIAEVATFNSPWAMDFLPGSIVALVTEKAGRLWLVDVNERRASSRSRGVPRVSSAGQGGLLDVQVGPRFAQDRQVYLTYSEPSKTAAASSPGACKLRRQPGRRAARQAPGHLARSDGRQGRPFRRAHRLRAGRQVAVPERWRAPALHAGAGPEPADGQDPAPDARRQSRRRAIRWRAGRRSDGDGDRPARGQRGGQSEPRAASSPGRVRTARPPKPGPRAIATRSASPSRPTAGCGKTRWARRAATSST